MDRHPLKHIIEAALLTAGKPLSMQRLQQLLADDDNPLAKEFVQSGLDALSRDLEGRGIELKLVASGYRLQVRQSLEPWIARLFEERPPRYSRALLETLALIGYRQPITRAEIEDVRGVSVSSNIIRTLLEREWVKVVGHRDVPGRPSMYGTTKQFLDYFNLKSLAELPELGELMDLDKASTAFDEASGEAANDGGEGAADATEVEEASASADAASEESELESATADNQNGAETDEQIEAAEPAPEVVESLEVEAVDALDEGESQADIDADVESLIRMLDTEAGSSPPSEFVPAETPTKESLQHEAARGESITPADLLRRHSTDS